MKPPPQVKRRNTQVVQLAQECCGQVTVANSLSLARPFSAGLPSDIPRARWRAFLFAFTLFISTALLFLVQPMIAEMILPSFGGLSAVRNTRQVNPDRVAVVSPG